jgi:hypothetical protein
LQVYPFDPGKVRFHFFLEITFIREDDIPRNSHVAFLHVSSFRCEKLQTCVVSVRPDTLGDACPSTPKYLEVHYFCKVETNPSSPRHSPHFPDTELTALWDQQNSHKVNIDSVLRAMKERENDISTQRVPITTEPESPKPSPKIQSALSDVNETNYPVRLETEVYSRDESFNDQSSTLDTQTTIETAPLPEMKERFEVENASLGWLEEEEDDPEKPPEETSNTMFVLEVVTYAVAAICGIILIFLIAKVKYFAYFPKRMVYKKIFFSFYFSFGEPVFLRPAPAGESRSRVQDTPTPAPGPV